MRQIHSEREIPAEVVSTANVSAAVRVSFEELQPCLNTRHPLHKGKVTFVAALRSLWGKQNQYRVRYRFGRRNIRILPTLARCSRRDGQGTYESVQDETGC